MLYFIGLGLCDGDIVWRGIDALRSADTAYVELYTNSIDYDLAALEQETGTEIVELSREQVEDADQVLETAQDEDVAFLVSGDPLTATTHQDILFRAREQGIATDVVHAPSILTAVAETGLSSYKFGRVTTLPEPYNGAVPDSPFDVIAQNREQGLHTLLLLDIGMTAEDALAIIADRLPAEQDVLVVSRLGTADSTIAYGAPGAIDAEAFDVPCAVIVPGDLSDNERERIEAFRTEEIA